MSKYTVVLILLLVGIPLGFSSVGKYRLSGDEVLTLNIATGLGHGPLITKTGWVGSLPVNKKVFTQNDYWARNSLSNVVQSTVSFNGTMVSYNILLYYIIKMTEVDDSLLIGLSALFYLISIILVFFITKNLFTDTKIAIISAGLYMLNPFVIHTAHNLRCYGFVTMLTLFASLIILKLAKQNSMSLKLKTVWSILLGILYGMAFLGQFMCIYILMGHFLYASYCYLKLKKNIFIELFSAFFICFLLYLVWWTHGGKEGLVNMQITDKAILNMTSAQTHTSLVNLVTGTVCFLNSVTGYYFQFLGYRNSSFFFLLLLPAIVIAIALWRKSLTKITNQNLVFLLIMILSAIFFLQLCCIKSGHTSSLIWPRFGSFVAPYIMILFGYSLYQLFSAKHISLKFAAVFILSAHVILGIMCYPIPFQGYWFSYADVNGEVAKARSEKIPPNPYPIIANDIMTRYTPGDTVVYNNSVISQDVNLYLRDAQVPILQTVDSLQKAGYVIKNSTHKIAL